VWSNNQRTPEAKLDLQLGNVYLIGKGVVHGTTPKLDAVEREHIRLVLQYIVGRTVTVGLEEGTFRIRRRSQVELEIWVKSM
jgi:hypothetical protein